MSDLVYVYDQPRYLQNMNLCVKPLIIFYNLATMVYVVFFGFEDEYGIVITELPSG